METAPENPSAIVLSVEGAHASGRGFELRPAASRTSSDSMGQLQREWVSVSEVSSGMDADGSAATVALDAVQA